MEEKKTIDFQKFTKLPGNFVEIAGQDWLYDAKTGERTDIPVYHMRKYWDEQLLKIATTKSPFYTEPRHMKPTLSDRIRRFIRRKVDEIIDRLRGEYE